MVVHVTSQSRSAESRDTEDIARGQLERRSTAALTLREAVLRVQQPAEGSDEGEEVDEEGCAIVDWPLASSSRRACELGRS